MFGLIRCLYGFLYSCGEMSPNPLVPRPLMGLLYHPLMTDEYVKVKPNYSALIFS
jgi:hypothetical protein